MFFADAGAVITYFNQNPFAINFIGAGFNHAILFAIFNGIINQVYKYLSDFFLVSEYC